MKPFRCNVPWMSLIMVFLCAGCASGSGRDAGIDGDGGEADSGDGSTADLDPGECGFEPIPYDRMGEVIQVASPDGNTCVKLVRKVGALCRAGGFSVDFDLQSLTVGHAGQTVTITDPASLQYRCTLHNWFDEAEGTREGFLYHLDMDVDERDTNIIHYFILASNAQTRELLWGPVELLPLLR